MLMNLRRIPRVGCVLLLVSAVPAWGANPAFQSFFFDVCSGPIAGDLATLCAVSAGGDLSGNSESSLTPSQGLSSSDGALNSGRSRGEDPFASRDANLSLVREEVGPWSVLVQARGAWEELDRRPDVDNERGYDADIWAFDIGFDQAVSDQFTWGAVFTIGRDELEFDAEAPGVGFTPFSNAGSIDADSLGMRLFAQWRMDAWFLEATAGYTAYEYEIERQFVFQESTRTIPQVNMRTSADPDGDLVTASAAAGYDFTSGAWTIGLTGNLAYTSAEVDAYREQDLTQTGLSMLVGDTERTSLVGSLALDLTRAISMRSGVFVPQLRLQYQHEFDRDAESTTTSFVLDPSATAFTVRNDDPDEDYGSAALGMVFVLANGWIPYVEAEVLFGYDDFERYGITAGVRREL